MKGKPIDVHMFIQKLMKWKFMGEMIYIYRELLGFSRSLRIKCNFDVMQIDVRECVRLKGYIYI